MKKSLFVLSMTVEGDQQTQSTQPKKDDNPDDNDDEADDLDGDLDGHGHMDTDKENHSDQTGSTPNMPTHRQTQW